MNGWGGCNDINDLLKKIYATHFEVGFYKIESFENRTKACVLCFVK